jgi:hypothetical protein
MSLSSMKMSTRCMSGSVTHYASNTDNRSSSGGSIVVEVMERDPLELSPLPGPPSRGTRAPAHADLDLPLHHGPPHRLLLIHPLLLLSSGVEDGITDWESLHRLCRGYNSGIHVVEAMEIDGGSLAPIIRVSVGDESF